MDLRAGPAEVALAVDRALELFCGAAARQVVLAHVGVRELALAPGLLVDDLGSTTQPSTL